MASKPKKRKAGRTTPPRTREMLLPLTAEVVSKVSLHNHLALVALRQGGQRRSHRRAVKDGVCRIRFVDSRSAGRKHWELCSRRVGSEGGDRARRSDRRMATCRVRMRKRRADPWSARSATGCVAEAPDRCREAAVDAGVGEGKFPKFDKPLI